MSGVIFEMGRLKKFSHVHGLVCVILEKPFKQKG